MSEQRKPTGGVQMKAQHVHPYNNARFWVFWRGAWVKLSLRQDQELCASWQAKDEEGYSYESFCWSHKGAMVFEEWSNGGSDCDGRIDRSGVSNCLLGELQAEPCIEPSESDTFNGAIIRRPNWQEATLTEIRDHSAEAANY